LNEPSTPLGAYEGIIAGSPVTMENADPTAIAFLLLATGMAFVAVCLVLARH
jgi:hypothetical protein